MASNIVISRLLVALTIASTLSGCAFKFDNTYPEHWPEPISVETGGCPDISGIYFNLENEPHYRSKDYLFDLITGEGIWGGHECSRCPVKLEWRNSQRRILRVTLFDESLESPKIVTLNSSQDDFVCSDDGVHIKNWGASEMFVVGVFTKDKLRFFLAKDGSLIAERRGFAVGHAAVIVPVASQGVDYIRWLRIDPSP